MYAADRRFHAVIFRIDLAPAAEDALVQIGLPVRPSEAVEFHHINSDILVHLSDFDAHLIRLRVLSFDASCRMRPSFVK